MDTNKTDLAEANLQHNTSIHLDDQIRAAVRSVEPPIGLKNLILENAPKSKARILYPNFKLCAIAAILVIGLFCTFTYFDLKGNNQLAKAADLRNAAAEYAVDARFLLDFNTDSLTSIQSWLDEHNAPNFKELPAELLTQAPIGCKTLTWREQPITLVCFHRDDGTIVHLFITDKNETTKALLADIQQIQRVHSVETGGWTTNDHIYLLSGSDPSVSIAEYMKAS